jgi:hypothetical protein
MANFLNMRNGLQWYMTNGNHHVWSRFGKSAAADWLEENNQMPFDAPVFRASAAFALAWNGACSLLALMPKAFGS